MTDYVIVGHRRIQVPIVTDTGYRVLNLVHSPNQETVTELVDAWADLHNLTDFDLLYDHAGNPSYIYTD